MNKKPNIICILTDDQGAWALRCAGNTDIHTPNLDYIAEHGMRFDNFFCVSPVCSPARASFLTGCIPSQHGVNDWIRSGNLDQSKLGDKKNDHYFNDEKIPIRYLEGLTTYTDLLSKHGYTCALAGKWHLGDSIHPQHGFSKWFTIGRGGCLYYRADVVENGTLSYETHYITDVITDKAISYIEELSEQKNPYYISVHYTAPHDPWAEEQHPKEYVEMYRDCDFTATPDLPVHPWQIPSAPSGTGEQRKNLLRGYYAAVTAMDANVGRILDKLREQNQLDDTLIIFTSDNGMNMGHHGIWGKGNGTFPFNLFDSSVKVPFLISWPKQIKENCVIESMHSHYDFIHTLVDLLELNVELPKHLPGKSFSHVLNGDMQDNNGHIVVFDEYGPNRMIRSKEWKYIHRYPYGPNELYHLTEDPEEYHNVIDDVQYQSILEELRRELENWFYQYVDPRIDASREGVTGHGQLRRPGIYSEGKEVYKKG